MWSLRRTILVVVVIVALLVISFLSSFFGPGPGPGTEDEPVRPPPPTGRVLDGAGRPVPGGTLVAAIGPAGRREARTGADGSFRLPGGAGAGGEYEVIAGSLRIREPAGPGYAEIRLPGTIDLAGRVVDEEGASPVAGASVECGGGSGVTDERGRFRVEGVPLNGVRLPPIRVRAPDGRETEYAPAGPEAWDDLYIRLRR